MWVVVAIAAVEGVLGAGGARWWTGRRARRVRASPDVLVAPRV
jgi:hypothetical protein